MSSLGTPKSSPQSIFQVDSEPALRPTRLQSIPSFPMSQPDSKVPSLEGVNFVPLSHARSSSASNSIFAKLSPIALDPDIPVPLYRRTSSNGELPSDVFGTASELRELASPPPYELNFDPDFAAFNPANTSSLIRQHSGFFPRMDFEMGPGGSPREGELGIKQEYDKDRFMPSPILVPSDRLSDQKPQFKFQPNAAFAKDWNAYAPSPTSISAVGESPASAVVASAQRPRDQAQEAAPPSINPRIQPKQRKSKPKEKKHANIDQQQGFSQPSEPLLPPQGYESASAHDPAMYESLQADEYTGDQGIGLGKGKSFGMAAGKNVPPVQVQPPLESQAQAPVNVNSAQGSENGNGEPKRIPSVEQGLSQMQISPDGADEKSFAYDSTTYPAQFNALAAPDLSNYPSSFALDPSASKQFAMPDAYQYSQQPQFPYYDPQYSFSSDSSLSSSLSAPPDQVQLKTEPAFEPQPQVKREARANGQLKQEGQSQARRPARKAKQAPKAESKLSTQPTVKRESARKKAEEQDEVNGESEEEEEKTSKEKIHEKGGRGRRRSQEEADEDYTESESSASESSSDEDDEEFEVSSPRSRPRRVILRGARRGVAKRPSASASSSSRSSSSRSASASSRALSALMRPRPDDNEVVLGIYTRKERREKIARWKEKKKRLSFTKTVMYQCRKSFADKRPRVGGRFVKIDPDAREQMLEKNQKAARTKNLAKMRVNAKKEKEQDLQQAPAAVSALSESAPAATVSTTALPPPVAPCAATPPRSNRGRRASFSRRDVPLEPASTASTASSSSSSFSSSSPSLGSVSSPSSASSPRRLSARLSQRPSSTSPQAAQGVRGLSVKIPPPPRDATGTRKRSLAPLVNDNHNYNADHSQSDSMGAQGQSSLHDFQNGNKQQQRGEARQQGEPVLEADPQYQAKSPTAPGPQGSESEFYHKLVHPSSQTSSGLAIGSPLNTSQFLNSGMSPSEG